MGNDGFRYELKKLEAYSDGSAAGLCTIWRRGCRIYVALHHTSQVEALALPRPMLAL